LEEWLTNRDFVSIIIFACGIPGFIKFSYQDEPVGEYVDANIFNILITRKTMGVVCW
jgi:hypothetical protein